ARTIAAPVLTPDSSYVSSGVFVTLRTSEEIFGRSTLTDALVIAPAPEDVPSVVDGLREAFRLEPGVFITERYGQFRRKVHDFAQTLALFTIISAATAALAGSFAANLLHDVLPIDGASTRCCSRLAFPRCKLQSWELPSGSRQ